MRTPLMPCFIFSGIEVSREPYAMKFSQRQFLNSNTCETERGICRRCPPPQLNLTLAALIYHTPYEQYSIVFKTTVNSKNTDDNVVYSSAVSQSDCIEYKTFIETYSDYNDIICL
jgi:hypothetical protein